MEIIARPVAFKKHLYIIKSVVVENNCLKPLTHALALGLIPWVSTEGSSKGLFLFLRQPFDSRYVTEPAWADKSGNTAHKHTPCEKCDQRWFGDW